jgi:hypothetical protein
MALAGSLIARPGTQETTAYIFFRIASTNAELAGGWAMIPIIRIYRTGGNIGRYMWGQVRPPAWSSLSFFKEHENLA